MSKGPKTRTRHFNVLLTEEEFEEFDEHTEGWGAKATVVRTAIKKHIEKMKKLNEGK